MPKYPKITDGSFYSKIKKLFSKYRITKQKKTIKEICYPRKYKLQLPQSF